MRSKHIKLISFIALAVILILSVPFIFVGNAANQENVIIRIHYVIESGAKVFNDYSVLLRLGDNYSAEVPSPTFSGYEPYILKDGEYVTAEKVALNYTNLQENQEITVTYRPAKSPYTVRYFLQNVYDDGYTENAGMTLRGTALTGEYPKADVEKKIDGFTPLFHEPDKVAADGGTEFLIYYERNYYRYDFDCNGGYGTDSIFARFGTNLVVPAPTKPGYVFQGWDKEVNGEYDGIADELPSTVGALDAKYKAIWEAVDTTARVVYWLEDPDDPTKHNYLAEGDPVTRKSGDHINIDRVESEKLHILPDTVVGSEHYEYDRETTIDVIKDTPAFEGDGSTIINIYYKRKEYTLKFYYARSKVENNETKYYVVGGSTYGFSTHNSSIDKDLLEYVENYDDTQPWGEVKTLPVYDEENYSGYYDKGSETYGEYTYYYISFTARYGQNIEDEWPFGSMEKPVFKAVDIVGTHSQWTNGTKAIFSGWTPEHHTKFCRTQAAAATPNYTVKGDYIRLDESLLYDSAYKDQETGEISFLAFWENGADISWSIPKLFVYNLYVEKLEGTPDAPGRKYVDYTHDGVTKRYLLYKSYGTCDNSSVAEQTATPLLGFTNIAQESGETPAFDANVYQSGYTVNFYYTRNRYTLTKRRYDNSVYGTVTLQNGASIKNYLNPPSYPDTLEPDAYVFDAWYHSPVRVAPMTEDTVMPANDMSMYAKWVPKKHYVTFSQTLEDMQNETYLKEGVTVDHNSKINTQDIPNPTWEGYEFKGWFYVDSKGEIHAFDPDTMAVSEDLNLFGQWQSPTIVKYTVHYVFDGNKIADDTEGHTFVGNTKTFEAKSENDLYQAYREGYFPKVNSKSIVIKPSESDNELTIEYEHTGKVNYTVKYVDSSTGEELYESKHEETSHSVITEQFKFIDGYVADAFYKRLILTTDENQNVLTFYYVKTDEKKINYAVKHFTENLDGNSYSEYSTEDFVGIQDEQVTASPLSITGFEYDKVKTEQENVNMIVSDSGVSCTLSEPVVINIYYKRKESSCTVHFVEYGKQENELKDPVTLNGKFEEVQPYTPDESITKDNIKYTIVGSKTRNITFRANDTDIYIYYQSKTILINYRVVCLYPDMTGGTVTPMSEFVTSGANASGSVPAAYNDFRFVGWYEDEACTKPVNGAWVKEGNRLVPNPADSMTYYALFEPITTLTITKSGVENSDQNQSFLFEVKGKNNDVDLKLSITGNGSAVINDLPLGEYTVTEITEWAWRYNAEGDSVKAITLTTDKDNNQLTFVNKRNDKKWLGGESQKDNRFAKISE